MPLGTLARQHEAREWRHVDQPEGGGRRLERVDERRTQNRGMGVQTRSFGGLRSEAVVEEAVFDRITDNWGQLDFVVHSMAFAPKEDLHGRVVDCSRDGFLLAMDVSCHSFIRMARLAEPLMTRGGTLFTMSFYGAHRVVEHYNLMGPVKAALEAAARYLAYELGPKGIRVHVISPGPLRTRAALGIGHFDQLLEDAAARAPARRLVTIDDIGIATAALAGDGARLITGETIYVDGGLHIVS